MSSTENTETAADKRWYESKKFTAYLVGVIAIIVVLLLQNRLKIDVVLASHGIDGIIALVFGLVLGQGAQDIVKIFRKPAA